MTGGASRNNASSNGASRNSAPATRARIDEVFGEILPRTTSDEARDRDARLGDDWWMEQRPPHHG